jgi:hypothetical protein
MTQTISETQDDVLDLEEHSKTGKEAPERKRYGLRVDKERFVVERPTITGREILALVGKTPELYRLYQHFRGGDSKIVKADEKVNLREPGVERFTTMKIENTDG